MDTTQLEQALLLVDSSINLLEQLDGLGQEVYALYKVRYDLLARLRAEEHS